MPKMIVDGVKRWQAQHTASARQLAARNTLGENAWKTRIYGLYATQEPQLYA